jgi:hypothetical protein
MRFHMGLMVAGAALIAALPAQAQNTYQAVTPSGGYVYSGNNNNNAAPIYNSGAQPLPMQQMIKGHNAPSYNFNGNNARPYNNFGTMNSKSGPMTVEEADRQRAMRDQQALEYERKLVSQVNAQNAQGGQNAQQGLGQYGQQLYQALPGAQQPQQLARQKRVIKREQDNPLNAPPRLFNPDQ